MPDLTSDRQRLLAAVLIGLALFLRNPLLHSQGLRMSWDASIGLNADGGRFSISTFRHVGLVPGRWSVGVGVRTTAYAGAVTDFRNRGTVTGALTAQVPIDPAVYGINAVVATDLRVAGPIHLEFNLDVAGFATGPAYRTGSLEAKPESGSLFLYGSRDRGSLNSELAVSLALTPRLRLRGGSSHYVLGYGVADGSSGAPASTPKSRYQRFFTVPFLAICLGR
jgi:hypothetical protein